MVVSLGNTAISFGRRCRGASRTTIVFAVEQRAANHGARSRNIHPGHLPWIFRYLGLYRCEAFLGQLNSGRTFSRPWLSGHMITFRTLPSFEGTRAHDHVGGSGTNYGPGGFLGNLTGLSTGNSGQYNTNTRFGIFGKVYIKRLRDTKSTPLIWPSIFSMRAAERCISSCCSRDRRTLPELMSRGSRSMGAPHCRAFKYCDY